MYVCMSMIIYINRQKDIRTSIHLSMYVYLYIYIYPNTGFGQFS